MSHTDVDHAAADAVVAHHAQLAADLTRLVAMFRGAVRVVVSREDGAAENPQDPQWALGQKALVNWVHRELLPHSAVEEGGLYAAAAAQEGGKLLIDGLVADHRALVRLSSELETAGTAVDAAGAAKALLALFEVHLEKENDLILPLLLASEEVSLAAILNDMHEVLGDEGEPVNLVLGSEYDEEDEQDEQDACGCGSHGHGGEEAGCGCGSEGCGGGGGCGCGDGGCGCGGHDEGAPQLLTIGTAR